MWVFVPVIVHKELLSELDFHLVLRAQQLLLVKIQKLMCRGGREEIDALRGLRVSSVKSLTKLGRALMRGNNFRVMDVIFALNLCVLITVCAHLKVRIRIKYKNALKTGKITQKRKSCHHLIKRYFEEGC